MAKLVMGPACLFLAVLALSTPHENAKPWLEMDYGPFLTASVASPRPAGNIAYKAIAVRVGEDARGRGAAVLFDTDLLR